MGSDFMRNYKTSGMQVSCTVFSRKQTGSVGRVLRAWEEAGPRALGGGLTPGPLSPAAWPTGRTGCRSAHSPTHRSADLRSGVASESPLTHLEIQPEPLHDVCSKGAGSENGT